MTSGAANGPWTGIYACRFVVGGTHATAQEGQLADGWCWCIGVGGWWGSGPVLSWFWLVLVLVPLH